MVSGAGTFSSASSARYKSYDLVDFEILVHYENDQRTRAAMQHKNCDVYCRIFYVKDLPEESRVRAMPCGASIPTGVLDAFYTYVKFDQVLE